MHSQCPLGTACASPCCTASWLLRSLQLPPRCGHQTQRSSSVLGSPGEGGGGVREGQVSEGGKGVG